MNEMLFRHEVKTENLPIYLPTKYHKKPKESQHVRRKLKIKKDNKIMTLVPKSLAQKT